MRRPVLVFFVVFVLLFVAVPSLIDLLVDWLWFG